MLSLVRRKSNSSRLYRVSPTCPLVVTWSPLASGAARYQQFTSCLLEGLYGMFSSPRKVLPWICITDQKTCLDVHNTWTVYQLQSECIQTGRFDGRHHVEKWFILKAVEGGEDVIGLVLWTSYSGVRLRYKQAGWNWKPQWRVLWQREQFVIMSLMLEGLNISMKQTKSWYWQLRQLVRSSLLIWMSCMWKKPVLQSQRR